MPDQWKIFAGLPETVLSVEAIEDHITSRNKGVLLQKSAMSITVQMDDGTVDCIDNITSRLPLKSQTFSEHMFGVHDAVIHLPHDVHAW